MKEEKAPEQKSNFPLPAGYLLVVEGDVNDADYVRSTSVINVEDIEKIKAWVKCIRAYGGNPNNPYARIKYEDFREDLGDVLVERDKGEVPAGWSENLTLEELEAAEWCEDETIVPRSPIDGCPVHTITDVDYYELFSLKPTSLV